MEKSREVSKVSDKIEQFWRDATADDVARVMRGETVMARFRDKTDEEWRPGLLSGWSRICESDSFQWAVSGGEFCQCCQVYDPPEWYVNKPDPGEGWRVLEKFPSEELQEGDEAWGNYQDNEWGKSGYAESGCRHQPKKVWYRRRIANNPTSSESCRSRDTIPSGWRVLGEDEERLASDAYWSLGAKDWIIICDDRVAIANSQKWHAIRQIVVADFFLLEGYDYSMPGGQTIRVTEKGFEVV